MNINYKYMVRLSSCVFIVLFTLALGGCGLVNDTKSSHLEGVYSEVMETVNFDNEITGKLPENFGYAIKDSVNNLSIEETIETFNKGYLL